MHFLKFPFHYNHVDFGGSPNLGNKYFGIKRFPWKFLIDCLQLVPTCQVSVVRFYISSTPPPSFAEPQLQARDRSVPRRTWTASSGSECSLPDLNCKLVIKAFPAGPEQQAQDQSVPCRTSTASSWSKRSPPDLNSKLRIRVFPAGPQLQARDQSVPRRTRTASSGLFPCKRKIAVFPAGPEQQAQIECQNMPDRMPNRM